MKKIKFNNEELVLINNRGKLELRDEYGIPYMSVNILDDRLNEGEYLIKNYSENEGILPALLEHDVIERPHRTLSSGFVVAPVVRLKEEI